MWKRATCGVRRAALGKDFFGTSALIHRSLLDKFHDFLFFFVVFYSQMTMQPSKRL